MFHYLIITPNPQPTPDGSSQGISDPQEETLATEGEYSDSYDTLGPIGRGAFGFVKLARKRDDELLVNLHLFCEHYSSSLCSSCMHC